MGNEVDFKVSVALAAENSPGALNAINKLHTHAEVGGVAFGRVFHGVRNPPERGFRSISDALKAWGFERVQCVDGVYYPDLLCFGDLKQYEEFFSALAPYWEGVILAKTDDGEQWGYRFKDGRMQRLTLCWIDEEGKVLKC